MSPPRKDIEMRHFIIVLLLAFALSAASASAASNSLVLTARSAIVDPAFGSVVDVAATRSVFPLAIVNLNG